MGRNRRRHGHRRWEERKDAPVVVDCHRSVGHRNITRTPPANPPPSMHPDYNPFQRQYNQANTDPRLHKTKVSSYHRRPPYPSTSQRLAARDRVLFQADWKLRQRHLKRHLVQTLNLAVQTIELWLPETTVFDDSSETDTGSDTSEDTVDEMEWQHEKEIVIPNRCEVRYIWGADPNSTFQRSNAEHDGFNMTPSCTSAPFSGHLVPRAYGQLLQGTGWSPRCAGGVNSDHGTREDTPDSL